MISAYYTTRALKWEELSGIFHIKKQNKKAIYKCKLFVYNIYYTVIFQLTI